MPKKKVKKSKKSEPDQSAWDYGWDQEQVLTDFICNKFKSEEELDDAFVGAFHALTLCMTNIFNKKYLLEIVEDIANNVEKENGERVCNDCKEKSESGEVLISDKVRNKMH